MRSESISKGTKRCGVLPAVLLSSNSTALLPLLNSCAPVFRRRTKELNQKVAKFKRGEPIQTKQVIIAWQWPKPVLSPRVQAHAFCLLVQIHDKKLQGKMRHTERLSSEAAVAAAKTDEWLLPAEAGTLEAEGMERTWRFSQVGVCLSTCAQCTCSTTGRGLLVV